LSRLHDLYSQYQQSPWLDNINRQWLHDGTLTQWINDGVRGITSNPSIFQKAITSSDLYDKQFRSLRQQGLSIEDCYWELVCSDIKDAALALTPLYESSNGLDGYVSIEVSPHLAHDGPGTAAAARALFRKVDMPNIYIKIPGTKACVPVIADMIAEGINVNVTLLFSVSRYEEVMHAYIDGLERCNKALGSVSSVASFFISRIDSAVDARATELGRTDLCGVAAIANAKDAYERFTSIFSGPRWQALADNGAAVQRPLWASTSTKNPSYSDTLYVDQLIGPQTVNTIPDSTLLAFLDHGTLANTLAADQAKAHSVLDDLATAGISLREITDQLEIDGVQSFIDSFDDLLSALAEKDQQFSA
jgi:transaldolase